IHRGGSGTGRDCDGHVELHSLALNRKWNVFLPHDHCADGMIVYGYLYTIQLSYVGRNGNAEEELKRILSFVT
ncbi:MAG: hypothetical protein ACRD4G_10320, partial [Bryobacteraceae bacterium]